MDRLHTSEDLSNKTVRIGVAGVVHETNTFSPITTTIDAFTPEWIEDKSDFISLYENTKTTMGAVIDQERNKRIEVDFGFYTDTMPSGMVSKDTTEVIVDNIVRSINYENIDGILLILHGAMVGEGYRDVEGEIISRVRKRAGEHLPIVVTLDLHANISRKMVENSSIIVGYDTYPHIDIYERGIEAVELLKSTILRQIQPIQVMKKPKMTIVPETMLTASGPMRQLMEKAFEMEKHRNVINITVAGGFPYSDTEESGVTFVVTTNQDHELGQRYADELATFAWSIREQFTFKAFKPEKAIQQACSYHEGPVILVEGSDNVGGGAPADATHTLQHLVSLTRKSLMVICDPEAVEDAILKGVGAEFSGYLGGKSDQLHGQPVKVKGKIRGLFDGEYRHLGPYMTGAKARMGKVAVLEMNNLTVVVTTERVAPWDIGHIKSVGLEAEDYHIIVVKSALAWKTAFGEMAKAIINVDTPGCCTSNLFNLAYRYTDTSYYPFNSVEAKK